MEIKVLSDFVINLAGTLVPGYLAYLVLYRTNTIILTKNRPEENRIILTVLSLINCFIGLFYLNKVSDSSWYSNIFFLAFLLFLFSIFILPVIAKMISFLFTNWVNIVREKNGYGRIQTTNNYKRIFDHPNGTRISIFDFSGNHIISGSVESIAEDNQFDYFDLLLSRKIERYDSLTQQEAIEMYEKAQINNMGEYKVYVDFEKRVILHLFKEK